MNTHYRVAFFGLCDFHDQVDIAVVVRAGTLGHLDRNVGLKKGTRLEKYVEDKYNANGFFILDTSIPGNSNRGHEFSSAWDATKDWDQQQQGVIGPEFTLDERLALIEYLKTL